MKKYICGLAFTALTISAPAHAQLTPVYGWLRTALENSMAQALPPYGKQDRAAATEARAQSNTNPSAQDRQEDATMKNAAAAEQEK
jgi:hypothetical protein